jgi:hypothetical protein
MNKEFIPYEQALELKELGFDEHCLAFYGGDGDSKIYYNSLRNGSGDYVPYKASERHKWFGAPLYQQAFRWFREKYGLDYEITYAGKKGEYHAFSVEYIYGNNGSSPSIFSYEEAELECLKKLIIIVERKPEAYS